MKRFTRTVAGKVTTAVVFVFFLLVTITCGAGIAVLASSGFYYESKEDLTKKHIRDSMGNESYSIVYNVLDSGSPVFYPVSGTNFRFVLYDPSGKVAAQSEGLDPEKNGIQWEYDFYFSVESDQSDAPPQIYLNGPYYPNGEKNVYTLRAYLEEGLPAADQYAQIVRLTDFAYSMRYAVYPIAVIAMLLTVTSFTTLLCAAARRPGSSELHPGPLNRVPTDLLILCTVTGIVILGPVTRSFYSSNMLVSSTVGVAACLTIISAFIGLSMSIAARVKQKTLFKNTVVWKFCKLLGWLFRSIPLVWKTSLSIGGVLLLDLLVFFCNANYPERLFFFLILEKLLLAPVILYSALLLRKLQKGGEALANGDLTYQVDTRRMFWDFKLHGENLNNISEGMARAVEQRMKSERMKTELITNVSHDIKTPLTSIINYADLISKEPSDNQTITEYSKVLLRQSERLKRLIDDLVEASKASTGNLEVTLAPCEIGVLLTQAAGEYEQRLRDAGLELVTVQPELPVQILADGRRLWRVFDNLMGNICKYAQNGTRVYLTLEGVKGEAVITFKNISRAALNLSPDELIERFVRGDASRSTDGNGLGLSIARSLTELQKGRMELAIDGDLFKVILRFPLIIQ